MIRKICSEKEKDYEAAPLYPSGALLWASFLSAVKLFSDSQDSILPLKTSLL